LGAGLLHFLDRSFCPPPHFLVHPQKPDQAPHPPFTIAPPQAFDSEEGPEHALPHSLPAIQDRVLVIVPAPHFFEHPLHAPNPPHLL
jgi:hypothetical protein